MEVDGRGLAAVVVGDPAEAIAAAVHEQEVTSREIAGRVEQAATDTKSMAQNVSTISKSAEYTGIATSELRDASESLSRHSELLRQEVHVFLADIRGDRRRVKAP